MPCRIESPVLAGSISNAIQQARAVGGFSLRLDVEVQSEAEADEAIDAGADIIMLDNLEGSELVDIASRLKKKWEGKRKFLFETSGNITERNLVDRAINGESLLSGELAVRRELMDSIAEVDILSTSAVHQSVQHIDFSLKIQKPQ